MARKVQITHECDLCGVENETVEPHEMTVDGKAPWVTDACPGCWGPAAVVFDNLMKAGTSKKVVERRAAKARQALASAAPAAIVETTSRTPARKASAKRSTTKNTGPKSTTRKPAKTAAKKTTSRTPRKATA